MWRIVPASTTRTKVDEECGGGQSVRPERGGNMVVEEEGADAVVEGTENTLGTAVLLRRIWTG